LKLSITAKLWCAIKAKGCCLFMWVWFQNIANGHTTFKKRAGHYLK